jgi:hypothetical protein
MNEDNKYYTPKIEEFHVGFEYEFVDGDSEDWEKDIISSKYDLKEVMGNLFLNFRVKYLDREDIESLGFKFDKFWIREEKGSIYLFNFYGLTYFNSTRTIKIWLRDTDECIFAGTIKNKSELKRLLKQLGI